MLPFLHSALNYLASSEFALPFAGGIVLFALVRMIVLLTYDDVLAHYVISTTWVKVTVTLDDETSKHMVLRADTRFPWAQYLKTMFYGVGIEACLLVLGVWFLSDYAGWVLAYLVVACTLPPAHHDIFGDRSHRYGVRQEINVLSRLS